MHRLTSILITFAVAVLACDGGASEATQLREAPDVPWPSAMIDGPVKSPLAVAKVLAGCFAEEVDYYSFQPQFFYGDKEPDGDDQQLAHLCVEWGAHLDLADCVRKGLIDLGGTVSF